MSKPVRLNTFISGIAVGSAVGALCGLLLAPRTGKETRKVLQKSAAALPELTEDLTGTIKMQADRLGEKTSHSWQKTLIRLQEAIAAGVAASQQEIKREKASISPQPNYPSKPSTRT